MTAELCLAKREMPFAKKTGRKPHYPWLTMEVDESFRFRDHVTQGSARVLASRAGDIYWPRKFRTRRLPGGLYCWRVR
jgi:hypothetical protein